VSGPRSNVNGRGTTHRYVCTGVEPVRLASHRHYGVLAHTTGMYRSIRPESGRSSGFLLVASNHRGRRWFSNAVAESPDKALMPLPLDSAKAGGKNDMTPSEMVEYLDRYIIGQPSAKRAVANAIRTRWRRLKVGEEMQEHVTPKNILMIGPTGVGKTEVARRLAKLLEAPFLKVEATKFTEVGFHGRDVDTIIRDLIDIGIKLEKKKLEEEYRDLAMATVERKLIEALLGKMANESDRTTWTKHLKAGWLDDRLVSIEVTPTDAPNFFEFEGGVKIVQSTRSPNRLLEKKKMPIKDARKRLLQMELDGRVSQDDVVSRAIETVEQSSVVFIDEIDKIVSKPGSPSGYDASSEGVQKDLLPLIEGCAIQTRYGNVNTDHILFVCSGSFHSVKPSDMLAELQGRLPVRVTLESLGKKEFLRILQEPEFNLLKQHKELLAVEGVEIQYTRDGIEEIAELAEECNYSLENIGARRLHTVVEKLFDNLSYEAPTLPNNTVVVIDKAYVRAEAAPLLKEGLFQTSTM